MGNLLSLVGHILVVSFPHLFLLDGNLGDIVELCDKEICVKLDI